MQTIVKDMTELKQAAEQYRDTDHHTVETMAVGECWAQGDLGIQFLGAKKPAGISRMSKPTAQLAPGETQGSRHILTNMADCKLYEFDRAHPLVGPVIEAPNGVDVDHPEHGRVTLKEPGFYAVRFQRAYDAQELRRVAD